jgi:tRNA(His) 5'-end guanylyltransferase
MCRQNLKTVNTFSYKIFFTKEEGNSIHYTIIYFDRKNVLIKMVICQRHFVSTDIEKAYNNINRNEIWELLKTDTKHVQRADREN